MLRQFWGYSNRWRRRVRGCTAVGIGMNRALAVAAEAGRPAVHVRERSTEPAAQVKVLTDVVTKMGLRGSPAGIALWKSISMSGKG